MIIDNTQYILQKLKWSLDIFKNILEQRNTFEVKSD